ncbi:MAG: nitroreductase family protein [Rikenellaceae bacterium]
MELKQIIAKRRSIRKFIDKPIEAEVLDRVLSLTLDAPSSRNSHSTRLMVVSGKANMEHIAAMRDYGSSFVASAPMAILVMGDRSTTDLWSVNCSISATTLQLVCVDEGLSSCWVHVDGRPHKQAEADGKTAEEHLREMLPIPDDCSVLCAVAVGYSDFEPKPLPEFDKAQMVSFVG